MSTPRSLQLPPGVTPIEIQTGRGRFAALDNEDALAQPPRGAVLLVPGFTGSKEDFLAILGPLAERGIRAVAFDQRGQYETPDGDAGEPYSLRGFAVDAISIAATLPRPLALVGHSFGGLVVREAVACDPGAADAIALIASGPGAVPEEQRPILQRFVEVMTEYGLAAVLQGKRALEAAAGVTLPPADIDAFISRRFLANSPASISAMINVLCEQPDNLDQLFGKSVKALVVVGVHDDVWSPEEQHEMAHRLNAQVVDIADAGHSPAVDAPHATVNALMQLF